MQELMHTRALMCVLALAMVALPARAQDECATDVLVRDACNLPHVYSAVLRRCECGEGYGQTNLGFCVPDPKFVEILSTMLGDTLRKAGVKCEDCTVLGKLEAIARFVDDALALVKDAACGASGCDLYSKLRTLAAPCPTCDACPTCGACDACCPTCVSEPCPTCGACDACCPTCVSCPTYPAPKPCVCATCAPAATCTNCRDLIATDMGCKLAQR
jgi:hypothetical protein